MATLAPSLESDDVKAARATPAEPGRLHSKYSLPLQRNLRRRGGGMSAFAPGNRQRHLHSGEGCRDGRLRIVPVTFRQAVVFIAEHHRHHRPPRGMKFAVGVSDGRGLVGVATVGRPVARHLDDGSTLEVTRTCTCQVPNANSMLYGAMWRAARALGYTRMLTYTQEGESGSSLRAAGLVRVAELRPRPGWHTPSRPRMDMGADRIARTRWEIRAANHGVAEGDQHRHVA
jgi:hypothetical protein